MIKRRLHPIDLQRRQAFHAWIKWSPMLVLLFCILFFDAWLSIETRNNDYELNDYKRQHRELQASLETLRVEQAQLESLDVLAVRAPDIGLVAPQPNQVVAVNTGGSSSFSGTLRQPMVTAQLKWENVSSDVGVLLTSKVPKSAESVELVSDGKDYLEESMEHLLETF